MNGPGHRGKGAHVGFLPTDLTSCHPSGHQSQGSWWPRSGTERLLKVD